MLLLGLRGISPPDALMSWCVFRLHLQYGGHISSKTVEDKGMRPPGFAGPVLGLSGISPPDAVPLLLSAPTPSSTRSAISLQGFTKRGYEISRITLLCLFYAASVPQTPYRPGAIPSSIFHTVCSSPTSTWKNRIKGVRGCVTRWRLSLLRVATMAEDGHFEEEDRGMERRYFL